MNWCSACRSCDLFLYKGRIIPQIPLELEAQFQSGYMYRASGTTGGRTEIYPKLSVPLDFGFGSVIGTVGLRQTYYNTDRKERTSPLAMFYGQFRFSPVRLANPVP